MALIDGFEIVALGTDDVNHTVELQEPVDENSPRAESVLRGMLMRVDTDRFFVRERYVEQKNG